MATKAVKQRVEEYAVMFRPRYGKELQIQVSNSNVKPFSSALKNVRVATLEMMKGLEPDKRDGKTPASMVVEFEDGKLFFIMDDIETAIVNTRGVVFYLGSYEVRFVEVQ